MKNFIALTLIMGMLLWSQQNGGETVLAAGDLGGQFTLFGEEEVESTIESNYDGKVSMEGQFLNGDLLKIVAQAEDFELPILGFAFHLKYDSEKVAFLKYEPGVFLEYGGDPFYLVTNDQIGNKIIFGSTLRREDDFPVGGDTVAEFYFQLLKDKEFIGDLQFQFDRGTVSTLDVVRQDLVNIEWQDLTLNWEESYDLVYSSETDGFDVLNGKNAFKISERSLFWMFLFCTVAALTAILLKKYSKNRPKTYVNFK